MAQLRRPNRTARLRRIQPARNPRVSAPRVQHAFKRRYFLAALICGPAWHHGFLIPSQPPGHLAQSLRLALIRHQIGKSRAARAHAVPFRIDPATG